MKKLLLILLPLTIVCLGGCDKPVCDNSLYTVCYIDIEGQEGDAITDCDNSGAYIGKVCASFGGCISSGINDNKR